MDGRAWALVLAILGLALGLIARYRDRRGDLRAAQTNIATIGVPIAIIVGTLPGILGFGERVRIAASIFSILISVTTIVLFVRHSLRSKS